MKFLQSLGLKKPTKTRATLIELVEEDMIDFAEEYFNTNADPDVSSQWRLVLHTIQANLYLPLEDVSLEKGRPKVFTVTLEMFDPKTSSLARHALNALLIKYQLSSYPPEHYQVLLDALEFINRRS